MVKTGTLSNVSPSMLLLGIGVDVATATALAPEMPARIKHQQGRMPRLRNGALHQQAILIDSFNLPLSNYLLDVELNSWQ